MLAGEYALHLLDADARRVFEARLSREPELRVLLRGWMRTVVHLADEIAPGYAARRVKRKIETVVFGGAKTGRQKALVDLVAGHRAGYGFGVGTVFIGGVAGDEFAPIGPRYVAEIVAEDHTIVVQARYDGGGAELQIERLAGQAIAGRVFELWLIAEGASAPVSLGVLPDAAVARSAPLTI